MHIKDKENYLKVLEELKENLFKNESKLLSDMHYANQVVYALSQSREVIEMTIDYIKREIEND